MTISSHIKSYAFDVTPQQLEPVIAEPIVQTALSIIGHIGAALMLLRRFIELAQMLRLGEFLMKFIRIYMPAIA